MKERQQRQSGLVTPQLGQATSLPQASPQPGLQQPQAAGSGQMQQQQLQGGQQTRQTPQNFPAQLPSQQQQQHPLSQQPGMNRQQQQQQMNAQRPALGQGQGQAQGQNDGQPQPRLSSGASGGGMAETIRVWTDEQLSSNTASLLKKLGAASTVSDSRSHVPRLYVEMGRTDGSVEGRSNEVLSLDTHRGFQTEKSPCTARGDQRDWRNVSSSRRLPLQKNAAYLLTSA